MYGDQYGEFVCGYMGMKGLKLESLVGTHPYDHSLFLNLRRLPKEQSNLHLLLKESNSSIPLGFLVHKASIQCFHFPHSYIPVSDLHDVFVVLQWPIQLVGILLGPRAYCEEWSQCFLDTSEFPLPLVSVVIGFNGRRLSALSPTTNLGSIL